MSYYNMVLAVDSSNPDALHLKGLVKFSLGDSESATALIEAAIANGGDMAIMGTNLGEVYRAARRFDDAEWMLVRSIEVDDRRTGGWNNLAQLYWELGRLEDAAVCFDRAVQLEPTKIPTLVDLGNVLYTLSSFELALKHFQTVLSLSSKNIPALMGVGTCLQKLGDMTSAHHYYTTVLSLQPDHSHALMNLGVILHSEGAIDDAIATYKTCLQASPDDIFILNNLGAALQVKGDNEESKQVLEKVLNIDPNMVAALVNLATYYMEEGDIVRGSNMLTKAYNESSSMNTPRVGLLARKAIAISPVPPPFSPSPSVVIESLQESVSSVAIHSLTSLSQRLKILDPVQSIERVNFYLPYLGGENDRDTQVMIDIMYQYACNKQVYGTKPNLNPQLPPPTSNSRVRVGFISKFFGPFEPHGLLLEGVIKHLPRTHFHVTLLPITSSSLHPPAPYLLEAADETIRLNLDYHTTKQMLQSIDLDVLIFADTLSEPMTYFLSRYRFAPVQAAFWGNPITTGSPNVDYFVSADRMEDPFRTTMERDVYEEQVVLLDGQGIWYTDFKELKNAYYEEADDDGFTEGAPKTLTDFGLPSSALAPGTKIYLCAQSLFKLNSAFDTVVQQVLTADPTGVVIFTSGRRESWTKTFKDRLSLTLPAEILSRVHLIPRVSSLSFPTLVSLSDVMLHPFPFGGSRTSLDGLAANIPVVTYPQRYLRGRMAASFYAQMGIWDCCVAWSVEEYVEKAVRLGRDKAYRDSVKALVSERLPRVYKDMKVVEEWTRWLGRVAGVREMEVDFWSERGKETWQEDDEINRVFTHMQGMQKEVGGTGSGSDRLESLLLVTAHLHNGRGEVVESLERLQQLMILRPRDANVMNDVGAVLQQLRRLEEARDVLRESVSIAGGGTAENNLGVVLKDLGHIDEALVHFLNAAKGGVGQAIENAANVFRDKGDILSAYSLLCESLFDLKTCNEKREVVKIVSALLLVEKLPSAAVQSKFGSEIAEILSKLKKYGGENVEKRACGLLTFLMWSRLGGADVEGIYERLSQIAEVGEQWDCGNDSSVHVIVQFWKDPDDFRMLESLMALHLNLANPCVAQVHVLLEREDHGLYINENNLGKHFVKVKMTTLGRRMSFADAFVYANANITIGGLAVLVNSDIILDYAGVGSLARGEGGIDKKKTAFALTRWGVREEKRIIPDDWRTYDYKGLVSTVGMTFLPRIDSQDTWVLRVPVDEAVIDQSDFFLGLPRCDGRMASILRSAGYEVSNPSPRLRTLEVQGVFVGGAAKRMEPGYETEKNVVGETEDVMISVL